MRCCQLVEETLLVFLGKTSGRSVVPLHDIHIHTLEHTLPAMQMSHKEFACGSLGSVEVVLTAAVGSVGPATLVCDLGDWPLVAMVWATHATCT